MNHDARRAQRARDRSKARRAARRPKFSPGAALAFLALVVLPAVLTIALAMRAGAALIAGAR